MDFSIQLDKKNTLMMKLIHYLMVEKNYSPIILQGIENEIWLENLTSDYPVVRIVSNHIINDEQLDYDIFRAKKIINKIKVKTFTFKMKVLSIYVDLDEELKIENQKNIDMVSITDEKDIKKYKFVLEIFPDIDKKLKFTEEGLQLFAKITSDISKKNIDTSEKVEEIFKPKVPYITYGLVIINVIIFVIMYVLNYRSFFINSFAVNRLMIVHKHEIYRLFTGGFLHADIFHLMFNMYALYVIGKQIETMLGRWKYLIIYLFSLLAGSLLSIVLNDSQSIGASGAIFGLMGCLLYFGYYYRVYLGQIVKSQILPIVIVNLLFGFIPGGNIDNFAHIGGLFGGFTSTMALGIKYKSNKFEKINGTIVSILYVILMLIIAFKFVE